MEEKRPRRIGLMGGTFDPIHVGHLLLAECAYEQFDLDCVFFLPSGNPPHKQSRVGASDEDRMEMVRLAIADNPHFALDPEEMYRSGFTYTSDTLKRLTGRLPEVEFYFIIGADSLMSFDTWHCPDEICSRCFLAVAVRDQLGEEKLAEKMRELEENYGARAFLLQTPDVDIASSHLRALRKMGRSVRYFVPEPVRNYIEQKNLYRG